MTISMKKIHPNPNKRVSIIVMASTRLLSGYAQPYRSQILDYQFKPDFGANTTCGSDTSHARTADKLHNPVLTEK
jgi:hypothetical protein